ncbi:MAG: nuclear transport factor 2 family protein, partial [Acidimicrobiia bacterium]
LSMGVMDKPDVVEAMGHAEPWKSFEILDPSLIPIEEDVVGLVYEATGRRDEDSDAYRANILSVYKRVNGEWQLILHQQTPLDT